MADEFAGSEIPDIYETDINYDYMQKHQAETDTVSDILHGAQAAVVDFGASIWNSLPGTEEVNTYDLLQRINPNAAQLYLENPEAIQTASFVGGVLAPTGIALKGMRWLRSGAKGADWFSDAGKAKKLSEIDDLYRAGPDMAKQYKATKNAMLARTVGNEMLDVTAAELALVGTMNAHPFMEDYVENPVKNFAIGLALGGAIGTGIGAIANRYTVRNLQGVAQAEAWGKIGEEFKGLPEGLPYVNRLQTHQENIDMLTNLSRKADENGLVKSYATDTLNHVKAAQQEDFQSLTKALKDTATPEEADALLRLLSVDTRFQGVEGIKYMQAPKIGPTLGDRALTQVKVADTNIFQDFFNSKGKLRTRAYSPEFDRFGTPGEILKISRANAIGETEGTLRAGWREAQRTVQVADQDAAFDVLARRAPEVDAQYLRRLAHIDKLTPEQLAKAVIAPDDLFTLNAIMAKVMKNPEELGGLKLALRRDTPDYLKIQKELPGIKAGHFAKTAAKATMAKLDPAMMQADTAELLRGWGQGGDNRLRAAFAGYKKPGWVPDTRFKELANELYEQPASQQLRTALKEEAADADGNIYLYRGLTAENPRGVGTLAGYSATYDEALIAAGGRESQVKLYKVHTDDIVGAVDNGKGQTNYLVLGPSTKKEATLELQAGIQVPASRMHLRTATQEISMPEMAGLLRDQKQSLLDSMIAKGVPMEVMAIRANVPYETVQAYTAMGGTANLFDLEALGLRSMTYADPAAIKEYVAKGAAPLQLSVNRNKVPYAELSAALDRKALDAANKEIVARFFEISQSGIAKKIGQYFFADERAQILGILRSQVSQAVSGKAGSKMFQSTDFFARDMGDFGKIASVVGKDVQHIANNAIKQLVSPMTELMENITKNPYALVEVNTALAFNAKLVGPRIYQERQFWQTVERLNSAGEAEKVLEPALFQGQEFKIVDDQVDKLLEELSTAGQELYALKNTAHAIQGIRDMPDLGFWVPPFNPKNKHIAYVHSADDRTSILWGNTEEELARAVQTFKQASATKIASGEIKIIESKGDQELYNIFTGRLDQIQMDVANIEMRHGGSSAPAIVRANADIFSDIVQGYEHYIQASVRHLAELSMADITDMLRYMSQVDQLKLKNQPLGFVQKLVSGRQDTASIMRNTLLGVSTLKDAPHWQLLNQSFETVLGIAGTQVQKIIKSAVAPFSKGAELKAEDLNRLDYEKLAAEMDAIGMHNPYQVFDDEAAKVFGLAKLTESKNASSRVVYASNALAATAALRFGEIAQPVVNAMSLPILTMSAISSKLPASFMGARLGTAKVNAAQLMYEGVRAAYSQNALHLKWAKDWEAAGYFDPMVSEATKVLKMSREFEPGFINKVEKAIDSNFVQWMSKPADASEALVRRTAMFTGANLAKRLYPELNDIGVTIFARDFMDKVVGNYHSAQRPTMFQGTLGVAMGLFQTYMVTTAQSMYRHLELKNYKALSKMMLTQAGIFGSSSLPGFHAVSEIIGEHFSDTNVDLITGTFRALPDTAANLLVYGVPSSLGPAFYTRGELSPRMPGSPGDLASVNMIGQSFEAILNSVKAVGAGDATMGQAFMQALSMQSISRPIARLSEIGTGYSITRQGNTVSSPAETWTTMGVFSRLLSMRPLEEAKLRDALHLNTVYGSLDREARQKVTASLKTAIRSGDLTDEKLEALAEEYMRTGTATGWRSALNTAIAQTEFSGKVPLQEKMRMTNPLNHMIDSLDGWE